MKNHEQLQALIKLAANPEHLKQFVQSYFMAYDYSQKKWQIDAFTTMVKSVEEMGELPGINESAKYRAEISQVVSALRGMHKLVEKEYYDKNSGIFGAVTKVGDWLRPANSLPEDVQRLKNALDSRAENVVGVSSNISTTRAQGATTAIGAATSSPSSSKPSVKFDIGELASTLDKSNKARNESKNQGQKR